MPYIFIRSHRKSEIEMVFNATINPSLLSSWASQVRTGYLFIHVSNQMTYCHHSIFTKSEEMNE